ncbi:MAG: heavy metal translocating P-type ATPase [Cocleimonas sp.]|nr:heavy metal translocating P-type ATPase [Cocleimonas sp.]
MNKTCFHCGLAIIQKSPPLLNIKGEQQGFCCHGCHAVCKTIIDSGKGDYYRYRDSQPHKQQQPLELMDKLKLYDNETIQRDFIRRDKKNNWKEAHLILEEIHCAACLWLNEQTIRQLDGVLEVQMDYTSQQAQVRWNPDKIKLSDILTAIHSIGYIAHPFDASHRQALNKEQQQRSVQRIIFAVILGMMVMQSAIGSYFLGNANQQGDYPLWVIISRWSSLLATGLILAYSGRLFFQNAARDLKNKTLGMDVPIALGLSIAWLASLLSTITQQGEVYYESIAMFVLFLLIARYIELRARLNAATLLDRTSKIIPQSAQRITNKKQEEVPVIELQTGDIIQVSIGETVPVDGILLSPQSLFDESLLTGESLAVQHQQGDAIISGSINIDQVIELQVQANSSNSTLSKLQQLTQKSLHDRPYYIELADQIAGKFVAVILLIAFATLFFWLWKDPSHAVSNMVSVLIVTCPCALALAAPVSLSLCAAGLSRLHLLVIRMSSIEEITQVDTIIFDKTGTLTTGIPILKQTLLMSDLSEKDALSIAASMEQGSAHPFAKALINVAKTFPPKKITQLQTHPSQGVSAYIKQQQWKLGSEEFITPHTLTPHQQEQIQHWRKQGFSVLYLSHSDELQAVFCFFDPLRDGIHDFLQSLTQIKHKVILSGDHPQSVQTIANQIGITEAYGNLTPQDKLNWIQQRQQAGQRVLMLGDGINDSPTLAASNVSISFSNATDLAQSHSDLIILRKDYKQLAAALRLMRKTRQIIIQNLSWAIAYNMIAIPAAAMGWVTPWMAAIGMSISSLIVVLNSLRLKQ